MTLPFRNQTSLFAAGLCILTTSLWHIWPASATAAHQDNTAENSTAQGDQQTGDDKNTEGKNTEGKNTEGKNIDEALKEQTIYIPYDKLREVFERDGRGVFLPYDKFQQLWSEARKHQPQAIDTSAPLGALITDIESIASLGEGIVSVDATLKLELMREGWHRVPLRLSDAAIRTASIGGREARVVTTADGQYELLIEHSSDVPETIQLQLSYAKTLYKTRGQSSVSFQSPQAPVNRWIIRSPEEGVEVQIEPMIATTNQTDSTLDSEGTEVLAFVGAAPEVTIRWTPKSEGASGLAALVFAETQQQVQVDEGVIRTSATVSLDISRADVTRLQLEVPLDQKVVNVFDRNVKRWDVQANESTQTIGIELFEPASGRQAVALELERFVDGIEDEPVTIPQIEVSGASRNQGMVLVNLGTGLRAEPSSKSGLLQMDKSELPAAVGTGDWRLAYRYASLPFELALAVEKIRPRINVQQLIEVALRPEKLRAELSLEYDVQQAGVFELSLHIPAEFEVRQVLPLARDDLAGAPVDTFYRDPNAADHWIVTLSRKAMGRVGLSVSLERPLSDPNLLSPTGTESDIEFSVPKVSLQSAEFSTGGLVVFAPESLQLSAAQTAGLRNASFGEVLSVLASRISVGNDLKPILAFEFSHNDAALTLRAKRRRPQVTVEQMMVVSVDSGVVKYDTHLHYDVRYSGVKSMRLDVPTELVGQLRNRSPNVIHQDLRPQPTDVAEGYTAWQLTSDNEFFGEHDIHFAWEENAAELPLGQSIDISVARLQPREVDRASGQIVTVKSETIDIRPKPDATGLRPIDPQTDLRSGPSIENAGLAFEFLDDWSLTLEATRYELEELKRTSISRAVVRVVALRQDELSIQALYRIRSVNQRLAIQMPEGFDASTSFDDQPVHVNGQPVTPERGGPGLIYVPLTNLNAGEVCLLELRYTLPGTHRQLDLPVFPEDPAVQKVYLCVYIPHEQALLSKAGPWTDEAIETGQTRLNQLFQRRGDQVGQYLTWVQEDIPVSGSLNQKFETDGQPYVFSALQPEGSPDGSLRLRSLNLVVLNILVCGAIGLVGLGLFRSKLSTQLAGLTLLVAGAVVAGIFFPLLIEHLLGETLLLTASAVAIVWGVGHVGRLKLKPTREAPAVPREPSADSGTARPPVAAAAGGPTSGEPDPVQVVSSTETARPDAGEAAESSPEDKKDAEDDQ